LWKNACKSEVKGKTMKKLGIILTFIFLALVGLHFLFAPVKDEFLEEDLYDKIISRGKLRVGINTESKPFSFINNKGEIIESGLQF
jgi:ABC-type amino acid transport substrate-binding protein